MKITAEIVHRCDCSQHVRMAIRLTAGVTAEIVVEFLTSAELARWFMDELERLNRRDTQLGPSDVAGETRCATKKC